MADWTSDQDDVIPMGKRKWAAPDPNGKITTLAAQHVNLQPTYSADPTPDEVAGGTDLTALFGPPVGSATKYPPLTFAPPPDIEIVDPADFLKYEFPTSESKLSDNPYSVGTVGWRQWNMDYIRQRDPEDYGAFDQEELRFAAAIHNEDNPVDPAQAILDSVQEPGGDPLYYLNQMARLYRSTGPKAPWKPTKAVDPAQQILDSVDNDDEYSEGDGDDEWWDQSIVSALAPLPGFSSLYLAIIDETPTIVVNGNVHPMVERDPDNRPGHYSVEVDGTLYTADVTFADPVAPAGTTVTYAFDKIVAADTAAKVAADQMQAALQRINQTFVTSLSNIADHFKQLGDAVADALNRPAGDPKFQPPPGSKKSPAKAASLRRGNCPKHGPIPAGGTCLKCRRG